MAAARVRVTAHAQVFNDGTVLMSNVSEADGGQYKCLAVSSAYRQTDQWTTHVIVASE